MRSVVLLLGVLWAGLVAAEPTHYIVFEVDDAGQPQPVFHAFVDIEADPSPLPPHPLPRSDSDFERFTWRPLHDGVAGADRLVEVPRFLRGEFARDPEHGDNRIVGHHHVQPERLAFVLRVPVAQARQIELVGERSLVHIDLEELAARADELPLADVALAQIGSRSDGLRGGPGSPLNRVDILVLGDGYTAGQQAVFNTHANALRTSMFNVSPYREYANLVNWNTGFIASAQSGADHPPYQAGCSTTECCADSSANSDPLAGTFVDTAFDGRFCTNQIHRLLTVNSGKIHAAAAAYPGWDVILVTVNDPVYGGAGGSISVTSAHTSGPLVVIHEYAHTFHRLADEYTSPYPGYPACSDTGAVPNCEANVTNQTVRDLVKWRHWYDPVNIPVPTPNNTPGTGLFQGARYLESGMYRPTHNSCLMRSLGTTFCPVCRQEYVKRLYSGWPNGVPAAGIDLIEPGGEFPSPSLPVTYAVGSNRLFSAQVLVPEGGVNMQWLLDGVPIPGASNQNHIFHLDTVLPATRTLELRVTDTSPFVHPQMADGLTVHTRQWTIHVVDLLFANGFE